MTRSLRLADGTWNGLLFVSLRFSHVVEAEMDCALAIVGLSARSFAALYEIASQPVPTQQALARRLGLEPSTTSELLCRLDRRGAVGRKKRRHGGDRRAPGSTGVVVSLTPGGREILEHAIRIASRIESRWARRLDRGPDTPWAGMRRHGLRRWLGEGVTALDARSAGSR